jgi:hypothetical protein
MSQSVEVTLAIASVELLLQAIQALGAACQRRGADYVARDADGTEIAVKVDPRTQRAVLVADGCGEKGVAFAKRIAQRYAYSRVADELRRKGYQLTSETTERDGTVKLVATRWAS